MRKRRSQRRRQFETSIRRMTIDEQRDWLAWLRGLQNRPLSGERVFYEVLPAGGKRRL